jgi:hypothetical protein
MLSPAWLGLFALTTFGGLVLASFASGYHLVMKTAPRTELVATAGETSSEAVGGGGAATAEPSAVAASELESPRAASDPAEGIVRTNLPPDRALVWSRPESKKIVGRLPSKQRVAVLGRQGTWLRIEFERAGKHISGWTMESNLQLN